MQQWFERAWQHGHPLLWLLAPLTLLFIGISALRRWLFAAGVKSSIEVDVPVVVVGNISVGGNGKTPTVLYLTELLQRSGYRPGIISRGYGGDSKQHPMLVDSNSDPKLCGDEPLLMAQRSQVPLAVGSDRVAAAKLLIDSGLVDILISDDGMQHYRLGRTIEVAVIDGVRRFGNGLRLPMGPLRESVGRLQYCDLLICNGGTAQSGEWLMKLQPADWLKVDGSGAATPAGEMVAMAGIGHPPRFFDTIAELGLRPVQCHAFVDHMPYSAEMLMPLVSAEQSLLMTEKDAVKCRDFAQHNWYYLPVSANLGEKFDSHFLTLLKEKLNGV
ncbi:tetraacyldisaccharide 4'-kinase [Ferrimonas lipolytica]|uniref:Tetraacyldisaccharide 4'-kinase n=1 Tax=Ferrimonas lipolytica TaxID=2724191 RepID=A0A6H1UBG6_9GAMM|nr:tetraacyldisaccharide 4'-kinase [Ferrimonas lipolytica]QIZ75989.1 tetraacyldisaccharide 4'-kinase [Ferrimonas lipolytica]